MAERERKREKEGTRRRARRELWGTTATDEREAAQVGLLQLMLVGGGLSWIESTRYCAQNNGPTFWCIDSCGVSWDWFLV